MNIKKYTKNSIGRHFRKLGFISLVDVDIERIEKLYGLEKHRSINELESILHELIIERDSDIYKWYNELIVNNIEYFNIENYRKSKKINNGNINFFLLRYDKEYGTSKYIKRKQSKGNSLEKAGKEKWDKICKQNSITAKTEYFTKKYGAKKALEIQKSKSTTSLKYFLSKTNGNVEEARKLQLERQSTFSLSKCIEKHGKEEGLLIFNKRQEKWQNTLNSKSKEEIELINQKKSIGRIHQLMTNKGFGNKGGVLYYIRFYNEDIEFWKIGITTYNIKKRFGSDEILHLKTKERGII